MFIPDGMKPKIKKLTESYLDEIFLFGEGTVVIIILFYHFVCLTSVLDKFNSRITRLTVCVLLKTEICERWKTPYVEKSN